MNPGATTPKVATGRQGERARSRFLEAATRYVKATTPNQRIDAEQACREAAIGLSPGEVMALTAAASRAVARET